MNALAFKTTPRNMTLKLIFGVILFYLASKALHFGIQSLSYFQDYPDTGIYPLVLLTHIGTGFIALVLGPWQFWDGLRKRFSKLHKLMGKIYFLSVLTSGTFGLSLGIYKLFFIQQLVFGTGIIGLALAWLFTGIIAYRFIRKGQINKHQEWMFRNYVVTFGFVSYRIGNEWMIQQGFSYNDTEIMAWLCWVPQLMLVDYYFQLRTQKSSFKDSSVKIRKFTH